jgi:hypothetical protein
LVELQPAIANTAAADKTPNPTFHFIAMVLSFFD